MFVPRHFVEDRVEVLVELVRASGFGHLVLNASDGLASTPVPFVVDDAATSVRAHLARPNPIWRDAPCDALLIVPVTDAYISPGWYPSKSEHGKVVPTWNYEVVHLHGRLVAHDDGDWVHHQIRDLTERNEAAMPAPWAVDDAPADYLDKMIKGIVGIDLEVDRIVGKRKLSQNRAAPDRTGVLEHLPANGQATRTVAEAMSEITGGDA